MAREFPTYVYYEEQEAKSTGEFIIRTVKPKFIARINRLDIYPGDFQLEILQWWDAIEDEKILNFYNDATIWFLNYRIRFNKRQSDNNNLI